jgi:phosphoribosylglycinamide formyltransferase-1
VAAATSAPASNRARVVVLASGAGTLLQSLIDATHADGYPAEVVAVVSDVPGCLALERAAAVGVPTAAVALRDHPDRPAWDRALADVVAAHRPDLVVSAGFMRILGADFLAAFGGRTLNTHPALLPSFPGAHAVRDALAYGVRVTGSTVHLVDAGVDTGPVIAQEAVPVLDDDDQASLHERIKVVERRLLAETVAALARHGWHLDGRRVRLGPAPRAASVDASSRVTDQAVHTADDMSHAAETPVAVVQPADTAAQPADATPPPLANHPA